MLSFLFPPICPLCAKELLDKGEHICKICSKKQIFIKEPTCYSCGKSMKNQEKEYCSDCRQHPKNFERGMGLCIYQKPVTDSLLRSNIRMRENLHSIIWKKFEKENTGNCCD